MGPERESAIRYLMGQVAKYRRDLAGWRRGAGRVGSGLANSMIVSPLQGLIDDATQLIARLRSRPAAARDAAKTDCGQTSDADF